MMEVFEGPWSLDLRTTTPYMLNVEVESCTAMAGYPQYKHWLGGQTAKNGYTESLLEPLAWVVNDEFVRSSQKGHQARRR
jgi:hypothetical protein